MLAKNLETAQLDIPVEYVDIDSNVTLTDDYGIRGVPTLVLLDDGKEVSRLVGVKTADELKAWASQ
jgi:thioredoxin-like negative regulator of GroEL